MALQGNLRDFAATEILQLLGTQRKSGCLALDQDAERVVIYVLDGRVVSTRTPGLAKDDPLLAFLRKSRRLSEEQTRGILTIQRESGRDLEDLLLNGRYLDGEELEGYLERQILDDMTRIAHWGNGTYSFDPHARWTQAPIARLNIEAILVEVARRADEHKRFETTFPEPLRLLGVRDLPDPDVTLSEEERELFGIVDGQHTVQEVVAAAPLSEYEAREALQRMADAGWIEVLSRRDPRLAAVPQAVPEPAAPERLAWGRELAVAAAMVLAVALLRLVAQVVAPGPDPRPAADVFSAAQVRDVRLALDLYHREHGAYPGRLTQLADDRWLTPGQLRSAGCVIQYHTLPGGRAYRLELAPDR